MSRYEQRIVRLIQSLQSEIGAQSNQDVLVLYQDGSGTLCATVLDWDEGADFEPEQFYDVFNRWLGKELGIS